MTVCRNVVIAPYEALTVVPVGGRAEGAPPRMTGPGQGIFLGTSVGIVSSGGWVNTGETDNARGTVVGKVIEGGIGNIGTAEEPAGVPAGDADGVRTPIVDDDLFVLQGGQNFDVPGIAPYGHSSHSLCIQVDP